MIKSKLSGWMIVLALICIIYNMAQIFNLPFLMDNLSRVVMNIVLFCYMRNHWGIIEANFIDGFGNVEDQDKYW